MSYSIPYEESIAPLATTPADLVFVPRSRTIWVPFLIPVLFCGLSYLTPGGLPLLTDMGFLVLAILCGVYFLKEVLYFPRRFGIGGAVLFGGVLVWFCQDYFIHWFLRNFQDPTVPMKAWVVVKSAFWHVLFIEMMVIGLEINAGRRWLVRTILIIPEPGGEIFYVALMLALFAFGISAFTFTTDPFYVSMYKAALGGIVDWTVYRTGNLNYSWGGYVAQIMQVGTVGGIFAAMYAIFIARRLPMKIVGWCIWAFWTLIAFQGGRRGELLFIAGPAVGMIFIKSQARVAAMFKRFSIKSYLVCGLLVLIALFFIQVQGSYRYIGVMNADFGNVDLTKNQGNTMFSEGLLGFSLIPETHGFFCASTPVEGLIRPIPETIFRLLISPIPRALWTTKPVDPLWEWYNKAYLGDANGRVGTTISHGLVGNWYFNYGFWGVIEGGLLLGWLMGSVERALQDSNGRPIGILCSLCLIAWLFRSYRDFSFVELDAFLIGAFALWIFVQLTRIFSGSPQPAMPT